MAQSVSSSAGKKLIRIDVSSDTVCPWCFVGKRNLDKAIASSKDQYDFEIRWHPFFLNPSAPKEGVNKKDFYENKFGSQNQGIIARMTEVFRGLGLEYNMSGLTKVGVEGAAEFLDDPNSGLNEVHEELKKYSANISGVPHFVLNGKHELSGGQPPEVYLRAFQVAAN
ncbi:DSBA domain-containing protein [Citrus sinensis]|uniref:DSBA domain-containing protein n=1 Tax=Citrus sinensis TaxID=2711 RepID=A0ACB8K487_CITSI|nr:DSBA domain-containing protein [Citrus sinensis]